MSAPEITPAPGLFYGVPNEVYHASAGATHGAAPPVENWLNGKEAASA